MKTSRILAVLFATMLIASPAAAHIKWFEPFDVTTQPKSIDAVLNTTFVTFFLISVALVFVFFMVDRIALRRGILDTFHKRLEVFDGLSVLIMRGAAGLFFAAAWAWPYSAISTSTLRRSCPPMRSGCPGSNWWWRSWR